MKNYIYALALFCFAVPSALQAQQDISLPGLVVRQNSRVKTGQVEYLSKVSIKATQAAPTRSDGRGQFSLVFSDKPAYNITRIFAEKSGMEVVNKTDLERAAVVGRLQKLKIVMCPAGEMMENQMVYYGIAEEAIVKRFKTRIAKLEAANTGLDNMIAEINEEFNLDLKTKAEAIHALEKEWSEALTSAQETAQKFASINLDDADSLYLQADAAFKKGDFERVLQLLQYDLLDKNIRNIRTNLSSADSLSAEGRSRIARGQENLRQTIQNALFAARVAKLDGAWKRAEDYYDLVVKGDEQDIKMVFEAARYMQDQNQFLKARSYYEKALTLTSQSFDKSTILNNLGILLRVTNEMGGAKQTYEEALQLSRQLAEKNPDVFLPDVAMTLNNLGIVLQVTNEMGGAKQTYEEALQLYKQLAEKNPEVYLPYVATTLNNLGNLLKDKNEMVRAKQTYEEALLIRRKLAEKNPEVYLPDLANTLNNLGALFYANNEMSGGKKAYEEALQIRRKLAEKNPDVFLPHVAGTLNNLGLLLSGNNEIGGGKQAYEEALQLYRQLAEKNPEVYLPDVANTLNNLGILLNATNEMGGAKQAYEEALLIRRQLAEKNPEVYLPHVATTLNNLGALLSDNNEMGGAKKSYEEALQIQRQLAEKNPEVYLPDVAMTLHNLGILLSGNNEIGGAKQAYEEALQLYRQLAEKNPRAYNLDLAVTDMNMGFFYVKLLKSTGEMSLKAAGLELMQDAEQRLAIFPEAHPLVQEYKPYIQEFTQLFKDFDEAAFQLEKQMEPISALEKANETEKDPHKKVQRQQEILGVLSEIEKAMPGNHEVANQMATHYSSLAWYQLFVRQFAEAEQSARTGLAKAPGEEWINTNLALALLYQGKWEAAKELYLSLKDKKDDVGKYKDIFLSDLDELEQAGVSHPDVKKARALLGKK